MIRRAVEYATLMVFLMAAATAMAAPSVNILDSAGDLLTGATVRLTGDATGAFYIVTDVDNNGTVELVDLDGAPIPDGRYSVEIQDQGGNPVGTSTWEIESGKAYVIGAGGSRTDVTADPSGPGGASGTVVGLAIAGGALLIAAGSGGGGGGGGGGDDEPEPVETGEIQVGQLACSVIDDPEGLESDIGQVGGLTQLSIGAGSNAEFQFPIAGTLTTATGSVSGSNLTASGTATVAGTSGVGVEVSGTYTPGGGPVSVEVLIDPAGLLVEQGESAGVRYACDGDLAA